MGEASARKSSKKHPPKNGNIPILKVTVALYCEEVILGVK
jgi:hypothetical protein